MSYSNGDYVVVRGQGLVKVHHVDRDGTVVVQLSVDDSDVVEVPAAETDKRLRACVDKATAEKLVAIVSKKDGKPDPRPGASSTSRSRKRCARATRSRSPSGCS